MSTAIAAWGNSEAVRLPRDIMRSAGLRKGDKVEFAINAAGRIELVPEKREHRRVVPAKGISFETLFGNYDDSATAVAAWPNDDLYGAEWDAWSN